MKPILWILLICLLFWYVVINAVIGHSEDAPLAKGFINVIQLCDAIYYAEGGKSTKHPYGILAKYKHTTPRQACINTILHALRDYTGEKDVYQFIKFLGSRYAPIGASNDPQGLNRNWVSNVYKLYNKGVKVCQ